MSVNRRRLLPATIALTVGAAGLVVGSGPAARASVPRVQRTRAASANAAASLPDLHVDSTACPASGDGSAGSPFCTISAAVAVVSPGQTIRVRAATYTENVAITTSGTPGAPITLAADYTPGWLVHLFGAGALTSTAPTLSLDGVHDVVVRGFDVENGKHGVAVAVNNSSNVTFDGGQAIGNQAAAVAVTGTSSAVTISRNALLGRPTSVSIVGATGTVLTTNSLPPGSSGAAVTVTDAPNTTVASNTVVTACQAGISLNGSSTGSSISNNIVDTALGLVGTPTACGVPAGATGVSVAASATAATTAGSNVIDPTSGGALYQWGATAYPSLTNFQAATGQGAADIAADPSLQASSTSRIYALKAGSPAIDSADLTAPGELATDIFDNARADNPAAANSGGGYADRGAREVVNAFRLNSAELTVADGGSPLAAVATATSTSPWTTTGPVGLFEYQLGGALVFTRATSMPVTFDRAGEECVTVSFSTDEFRETGGGGGSACTVLGAGYRPISPTRVLDTRAHIGVPTTTPIPAHGQVVVPLPTVDGVPAAQISALAVNITATGANGPGYLRVNSQSLVSNLNYTNGATVANLAMVPMADGLTIDNPGGSTVHVIADVQGLFGDLSDGFKQVTPIRVLDTRHGIGRAGMTPVPSAGAVPVNLSGSVPPGATAAILTLTATAATRTGFLTAYAGGSTRPAVSTLNFHSGQTVANLAIVPLSAGRGIELYNGSSGSTHLVADLVGFVGSRASGGTEVFVPYGPVRTYDSRVQALGGTGPLAPHITFLGYFYAMYGDCAPFCPLATGGFANITVTSARANGYVTIYPSTSHQRPAVSTLNFEAGVTRAALAFTSNINNIYLGTAGSMSLLADEQGYLIAGPS